MLAVVCGLLVLVAAIMKENDVCVCVCVRGICVCVYWWQRL